MPRLVSVAYFKENNSSRHQKLNKSCVDSYKCIAKNYCKKSFLIHILKSSLVFCKNKFSCQQWKHFGLNCKTKYCALKTHNLKSKLKKIFFFQNVFSIYKKKTKLKFIDKILKKTLFFALMKTHHKRQVHHRYKRKIHDKY